jgi:hypothetical protein
MLTQHRLRIAQRREVIFICSAGLAPRKKSKQPFGFSFGIANSLPS